MRKIVYGLLALMLVGIVLAQLQVSSIVDSAVTTLDVRPDDISAKPGIKPLTGIEIVKKNDFTVKFEPYFSGYDQELGVACDGLTNFCVQAEVSNDLIATRKFNLSASFFNTSFNPSKIDLKMFHLVTESYVDIESKTTCINNQFIDLKNLSRVDNITCSTVENPVIKIRDVFRPLQDQRTEKNPLDFKRIPVSNNTYDPRGTQTFLISWKVPLENANGFGASGEYGIIDVETENVYHPGFISNYGRRSNVTFSVSNRNQTVYINLSIARVNLTTPKGMEIRVTDFDNNPLPYQTIVRGLWNKGDGQIQNVSADWQKDNYTVVQLPSTYNVTGVYIYWANTTEQGDASTSLLIKKDSFTSYSAGAVPTGFFAKVTGVGGSFCAASTGRIALCATGGNGQHFFTSVNATNENHTINIEMNRTASATTNGLNFVTGDGAGAAGGYRSPQESASNNYILTRANGVSCGSNGTITTNFADAAMNVTVDRAGTQVNLYMRTSNTVLQHLSCSDTNLLSERTQELSGGNTGAPDSYAYLSFELWNVTTLVRNQPTVTFNTLETANNAPVVTIINPTNTSYTSNVTVLNFTAIVTSPDNITSCWYILNNEPLVSLGTTCQNATFTSQEGTNNLTVFANDTENDLGFAQVFYTIDTVFPFLNLSSPQNITYGPSNVNLTYDASDNLGSIVCTRELNGVNTTVASCANQSFTPVSGANTLRLYVRDTVNHTNVTSVQFTRDDVSPSLTLISPQNGTQTSPNVAITYTTSDPNNVTCKYELDSVNTTIAGCQNTSVLIASGTHLFRLYATDGVGNVRSATVNFTLNYFLLNITAKDESTLAPIINFTATVTDHALVTLQNSTTTGFLNYSNIAQLPPGDYEVQLSSVGYVTSTYQVTITANSTVILNGFLVNTTQAVLVTFFAVDASNTPLLGATITVQTFLNGSFQTVGQVMTDSSGNAQMAILQFVSYNGIGSYPGLPNVTKTFTSATTQPIQFTFGVSPTSPNYLQWLQGHIITNCFLNNNTRLIFCTVNDTVDVVSSYNLKAYRVFNNFTAIKVCDSTNTTVPYATLQCQLPIFNNTYTFTLTATTEDGVTVILFTGQISYTQPPNFGLIGIVAALILFMVCSFLLIGAGRWGLVMSIFFGYLSVAASWAIGFIQLGDQGSLMVISLGFVAFVFMAVIAKGD